MSRRAKIKFRLYVAGDAQNSTQAVANLRAFCRSHLPDLHDIEIVDVFREPKRALADGIFMTPTLVSSVLPLPEESSEHSVRRNPCCRLAESKPR